MWHVQYTTSSCVMLTKPASFPLHLQLVSDTVPTRGCAFCTTAATLPSCHATCQQQQCPHAVILTRGWPVNSPSLDSTACIRAQRKHREGSTSARLCLACRRHHLRLPGNWSSLGSVQHSVACCGGMQMLGFTAQATAQRTAGCCSICTCNQVGNQAHDLQKAAESQLPAGDAWYLQKTLLHCTVDAICGAAYHSFQKTFVRLSNN